MPLEASKGAGWDRCAHTPLPGRLHTLGQQRPAPMHLRGGKTQSAAGLSLHSTCTEIPLFPGECHGYECGLWCPLPLKMQRMISPVYITALLQGLDEATPAKFTALGTEGE